MKKFLIAFTFTIIFLSTNCINIFAAQNINFKDVPDSHWAYDVIADTTTSGYFKGYPDGRFRPDNQITRAEFISLFTGIVKKNFSVAKSDEDIEILKAFPDYKDVPKSHWAYDSIQNLWFYGGVFSKSDLSSRNTIDMIFGKDSLKPNQAITRAEVAELLCKLLNDSQAKLYLSSPFSDIKNHKFQYSIQILNTLGVINGYPDNTFKPNQGIKRSEAAKMVKNLVNANTSFKKTIWITDSNYTYDTSISSTVDVVKKVFQLELEGKFDEAYIYYSDNSKKALNLKDYKDYMRNINLQISKNVSYWSWERVNDLTEFSTTEDSLNQAKVNYICTLENGDTREGIIKLEKQNNKWFIVLQDNQ